MDREGRMEIQIGILKLNQTLRVTDTQIETMRDRCTKRLGRECTIFMKISIDSFEIK